MSWRNKVMMTLVTGGIRSGKSRYALELAKQAAVSGPRYFLATAEPIDSEIKIRIARHKEERSEDFVTIEEPLHLARAIDLACAAPGIMVVDCLTLWVNNLLYHFENAPERIQAEIQALVHTASLKKMEMIFVTNEVGMGLVADNALSRRYVDELGYLNQALARVCDEVILMVSGIATHVKGVASARLGH